MSRVYVIMGVAGSGKTTVGSALAGKLGAPFYDGDAFHPPENVAKMRQGIPLEDEDRVPWLARLRDLIGEHLARGETAVIACSALKKQYRNRLRQGNEGLCLIYLQGSPALIEERLKARQAHFMKADMLQSQMAILEPPSPHEALVVNIEQSVADIVNEILRKLARQTEHLAGDAESKEINMNPLQQLHNYGQSFWYDNIRRSYLHDGTLAGLIQNDGLRGLTSNPSIFEKAIAGGEEYDAQIAELAAAGKSVAEIYDALTISDIQAACDLFQPLYLVSNRQDGYVSLEVSPYLARDTEGTIADAKRLFATVARPNLMIKVPATDEGIPAIQALIGVGINVNVTLMFNVRHYEAVAQAYIAGLTDFVAQGGDPATVASVASFFVSRVDTIVDEALAALDGVDHLFGKTAVVNSKIVYQRFKEIFHGAPFAALKARGAQVQRLLWASTSTKNPAYVDTMYIDDLIGPETVSTIPPNTVEAFRDHGKVGNTLETAVAEAEALLTELAERGVELAALTEQLQVEGVAAFSQSFDALLAALDQKRASLLAALN